MALKLKLKVSSEPKNGNDDHASVPSSSRPKIRVKKPSLAQESEHRVSKSKVPKEKHKKLKISIGKAPDVPREPQSHSNGGSTLQPILKKVPKVRVKPTRVPGEGYDSEAPDVEDDPLLENAIAVRFVDDANLDFLHSAADTGDFSNVNIKWITRDKAVVNVNSTLYSARLVDLPTLIELYKTVDKKNIFKTIDVSQILLVLRTINPKQLNMETDFEVPEEYTYTHPLYKLSRNKEIRPTKTVYRDGLSAPFEDVYRRFRPLKTNYRVMTDIESRVDEIVRRDNEAQESHYEYVSTKFSLHGYGGNARTNDRLHSSPSTPSFHRDGSASTGVESDGLQSLHGDEEEEEQEEQMALDLEADLDIALEQELADALDSTTNTAAATVLMKSEYDNDDPDDDAAGTEAANGVDDDDDDEDDDDEEEEEEDDEDDDDDDTTKQDNSRAKKLEEEIVDLQTAAEKQKVLLANASYKMMRMKFQSAYNNLKVQLDQKKRELSKIREQQQKQQQQQNRDFSTAATQQPEGNADDEDDDNEEDDEDEDVDNEDVDDHDDQADDATAEAGLLNVVGEATKEGAEKDKDAALEGKDNEENIDDEYEDFQGLF